MLAILRCTCLDSGSASVMSVVTIPGLKAVQVESINSEGSSSLLDEVSETLSLEIRVIAEVLGGAFDSNSSSGL